MPTCGTTSRWMELSPLADKCRTSCPAPALSARSEPRPSCATAATSGSRWCAASSATKSPASSSWSVPTRRTAPIAVGRGAPRRGRGGAGPAGRWQRCARRRPCGVGALRRRGELQRGGRDRVAVQRERRQEVYRRHLAGRERRVDLAPRRLVSAGAAHLGEQRVGSGASGGGGVGEAGEQRRFDLAQVGAELAEPACLAGRRRSTA